MNKIFGIKLVNPSAPKKGINKEILKDISYGGETDYFVTKKVYEHREDELNFDYQYLVGVMESRLARLLTSCSHGSLMISGNMVLQRALSTVVSHGLRELTRTFIWLSSSA